MAIGGMRPGGLGSSAWEQTQVWAAKRRAMMEDFAVAADLVNSSIASANANRISGQGDLAANAALNRIRAATLAKLNKRA